ncbi:hypothetical protein Q5H93_06470 [Hymenobacter sp. ASUV-10]|uniref:Lipoprotein n=1 Tax=Hymenobacter aranciens TaxID=3063996 RepID=A0ABT9B816_9BACT|nr:hypothetical protein [Hymenobacter sp. ASUV-10]MDO7874370.1 hypothetical protein [Hymenobacter sp. ASUV-10]
MTAVSRMWAAGLLLTGLSACQAEGPAPQASSNFIKVNFDGQTKTYTNASLGEGRLCSLSSYSISGGNAAGDDLSITIFATKAGTYPYRQDVNVYHDGSQVEYKTGGEVFNNYKALVCPTSAGYYSTVGQVVVTEYVPGQRVRGTFAGALLNPNDPNECSKQGKLFSGEFYWVKH